MKVNKIRKPKKQRKMRIRSKIHGTEDRPRLSVYRSNKNIYAQLIDDKDGNTLVAFSSMKIQNSGTKQEQAFRVGQELAKEALKKGIKKVVFDRNNYKYHGRIKKLAEGSREGGLEF